MIDCTGLMWNASEWSWIFTLQSTCMEVSVSFSCLSMSHHTKTTVVCCNPIFHCTWNTTLLSTLVWGLLRLAPTISMLSCTYTYIHTYTYSTVYQRINLRVSHRMAMLARILLDIVCIFYNLTNNFWMAKVETSKNSMIK